MVSVTNCDFCVLDNKLVMATKIIRVRHPVKFKVEFCKDHRAEAQKRANMKGDKLLEALLETENSIQKMLTEAHNLG